MQPQVQPQPSPQPPPSPAPTGLGPALDRGKIELVQPEVEKRGRGRPKSSKTNRNKIIDGKTGKPLDVPTPPDPVEPLVAEDIAPALTGTYSTIFNLIAEKRDCEALALSDQEASLCGSQTAAVIAAWCPQVTGKQAITVAALLAVAGVFFQKFQIDRAHQEERRNTRLKNTQSPVPPAEPVIPPAHT